MSGDILAMKIIAASHGHYLSLKINLEMKALSDLTGRSLRYSSSIEPFHCSLYASISARVLKTGVPKRIK